MTQTRGGQIQAIVFDLDGTLYDQKPVRRAMLGRLLRAHAARPVQGFKTFRLLGAYRRAQEQMRHAPDGTETDLGRRQAQAAARSAGVPIEHAEACVERWMGREPLDLLRRHRRQGLTELLEAAHAQGLRLGLLSDYPARDKLRALEVDRFFDATVCAQDPEVGVFKPDPRGLLVTLRRLDVSPAAALYVGDRPEVDAAAARAAGVDCVIITGKPGGADCRTAASCAALKSMLFD